MLNPSYEIGIPHGTTAYIDGNELTDSYLSDSQQEKSQDTYVIKGMLVGKHNLKITSKIYDDFEQHIDVHENKGSANVYQSQLEINKDTQDKTETTAKEFIQAYFDAGVAGKNFSEIKKYFKSDSGTQVKMEQKYNNFVKSLKPSADRGIDKATLSEVSGKAEKGYSSSKEIDVNIDLTFKLEYSGTKKNIFTNAIDPITSNGPQPYSKNLHFTLENDKWVISDMDTCYISFY